MGLQTKTVLSTLTANVQVTHSASTNHARSESTLVIHPTNPNHMVACSKRFINPQAYSFTLRAVVSTNGGASWTEAAEFELPSGWEGISDPALAFDDQGNVFLVALPFGPPDLTVIGIAVYKSTDGGFNWSSPLLIHTASGDDKQWAAGDTNSGSPYVGRVYAVWDEGSTMRFARSLDHGGNWKGVGNTPIANTSLATDSFSPEISVAPNGDVFVVYWNRYDYSANPKHIRFVRSTNGGESFSAPITIATPITSLEDKLPKTSGWAHFPGSTFRVLTMATACAGQNGEIVAAWSDARNIAGGQAVSRIFFTRSTNGGASWPSGSGTPLLDPSLDPDLGDPTVHHFHPQLACSPDGVIACAFYELRKVGGKNVIDVKVAASLDGGATFSLIATATEQPWDPAIGAPWSHGDSTVTFIGEYFGFDASSQGFFPVWTDTRTGMQELWSVRLGLRVVVTGLGDYAIGGKVIGGVAVDGGGWIITPGGHPIPVPPWDPLIDALSALAAYRIADEIRDRKLRASVQTAALDAVAVLAHKKALGLAAGTKAVLGADAILAASGDGARVGDGGPS